MRITHFIFTISTLLAQFAYCQSDKDIVVYDSLNQMPLNYAHVYNSEGSYGTITNSEGHFLLIKDADHSDSISISFTGYPLTTLSYAELLKMDTVFIKEEATELDEFVVYSPEFILEKVRKNLDQNYSTEPTVENYFVRYFVKRDTNKIQIIESLVEISKNYSFGKSEGRNEKLAILGVKNIVNKKVIDKVEFVPNSFNSVFSFSDRLSKFEAKYDFITEKLSSNKIRISFTLVDSSFLESGPFDGYVVVNTKDYAMEEFYYQKKYLNFRTKLKKGFEKEEMYFSNMRVWKKNNLTSKYQLQVMATNGDLLLANKELGQNHHYKYNYLIQRKGDLSLEAIKRKKVRQKKRPINAYKEYNIPFMDLISRDVILKTKEQNSIN